LNKEAFVAQAHEDGLLSKRCNISTNLQAVICKKAQPHLAVISSAKPALSSPFREPNNRTLGFRCESLRGVEILHLVDSSLNLVEQSCPSKFLIVCLNRYKSTWRKEGESEEHDISSWGLDLWRCCSNGLSNVLDTSGHCASREQIAWLVSGISDIMARKEKQRDSCLLALLTVQVYIVPTQEGSLSSAARHTSGTTDSRWIHGGSFKIGEARISTRIKRRQNRAARCSAAGDKNSA
jgi:hypothetical protein